MKEVGFLKKEKEYEKACKATVMKDVLYLAEKIAVIAITTIILFTFVFGIERYCDCYMNPSIKDGDLVIFYRLHKDYHCSDVVAIKVYDKKTVGRIVAVQGDIVDITENGLMINGALQEERDIYEKTERYAQGIDFPITVSKGEVFILGDSREHSYDSRIYGCIKNEDILGKVITIIRRRSI